LTAVGTVPQRRVNLHVDPTNEVNQRLMQGERELQVSNGDRAVAATLAGFLSTRPDAQPVSMDLYGYVGQGLGFALVDKMHLRLIGYANDSVGEAMSGGICVVKQPAEIDAVARATASVVGNAACYGATGGKLFVEGRAGQRLGVRNSGAIMVTEGAGKYAFEYMTGGIGVVLGPVGAVVGSGMTGGVVWLYDAEGQRVIDERLHKESVRSGAATGEDLVELKQLIEEHFRETQSPRARSILDDWEQAQLRFVKVVPAGAEAPAQPVMAAADGLVQISKA
jgi:glutamate synthase (ferredoxin)